jgi:AcrR family transcriptional regulator
LNISELEKVSGLRRTTIYHYVRVGLLSPQRVNGGTRAFYGKEHVARLEEIVRLRQMGLSVSEVRTLLATTKLDSAVPVDAAPEQPVDTRELILRVALRKFVARGYRGTRIADIIAESQVPGYTFYRFFSSKKELFVNVVELFFERSIENAENHLLSEPDPVMRHLYRVTSFLETRNVSPEMLTFLRAEALGTDEETRELLMRIYRTWASYHLRDLAPLTEPDKTAPNTNDELLAYAFIGVQESIAMRLAWDNQYSLEDCLWTSLQLMLAVRAIYLGPIDIAQEMEKYASRVRELAANPNIMGHALFIGGESN